MSWEQKTIELHKQAAMLLDQIKDEAFGLLRDGITEWKIASYIRARMAHFGLVTDHDPIVAFGSSGEDFHYYPNKETSKELKPESVVMIDLWARLDQEGAPYADITWMGYHGKRIPDKVQEAFELVLQGRDNVVEYIRGELEVGNMPVGQVCDRLAFAPIIAAGYERQHNCGHSLGFDSPHGKPPGLQAKNPEFLVPNLPYTIEPGLYTKDFGIRLEMDFYIKDNELVATGPVQHSWVRANLQ